METKKFDEFVSDIFFDEAVDDNVMVASSGEGNWLTLHLEKGHLLAAKLIPDVKLIVCAWFRHFVGTM